MNLYKTALSALLIAPIVGGISVQMIHGYQNSKKLAERYVSDAETQMERVAAMLDEELYNGEDIESFDESMYDLYNNEYTDEVQAILPNENLKDTEVEDASIYIDEKTILDDITNSVIRFHIRANSDSEEDQALKIKVRDAVLSYLEPELSVAGNRKEAKAIMEEHLEDIEAVSLSVIRAEGYNYDVQAYLTKEEFPLKSYGDLLFPAGEYEALRVDIGESEGGNWWCVMYPGLCFVDTAGGVVSTDGKEELRQILTPEEYEELLICPENEVQVEYRSYFWDILTGEN